MRKINVIWFKRDLRIQDHLPLVQATRSGSVLPIYIFEPSIINAPDFSRQHQLFISECLINLQEDLGRLGLDLLQFVGEATDVFSEINRVYEDIHIWAHEETFNWRSYQRDILVRKWCSSNGIPFTETPQNAVLRGSRGKLPHQAWLAHLKTFSNEEPLSVPRSASMAQVRPIPSFDIGENPPPIATGLDKPLRLKGGRKQAETLLDEFFSVKLLEYSRSMSSPISAVSYCSRLSPYLAQGVVSMRELLYQMTLALDLAKQGGLSQSSRVLDALNFFSERLYWRSSYLQALEANPSIEHTVIDPLMRGIREPQFSDRLFNAWKEGATGYPMVDAAMLMLAKHGWINMRMRGMLMSFASNELWLHWEKPAQFLAKEFLDYEPAIHYAQMQIHSSTFPGNQSLAYNAVKQARDHDPRGLFVKEWIPALKLVPLDYIYEPWTMPSHVQVASNCIIGEDYPSPIVNHIGAHKTAREIIAAVKSGLPIPHKLLANKRALDIFNAKQKSLF